MAIAKNGSLVPNWAMTITVAAKIAHGKCEVTFGTRSGIEYILVGIADGVTIPEGPFVVLNDKQQEELRDSANAENDNLGEVQGERMYLPIKRASFPAAGARTVWEALMRKGFVIKEQ